MGATLGASENQHVNQETNQRIKPNSGQIPMECPWTMETPPSLSNAI